MSVKIAEPKHEVLYQELIALISKHAAEISAEEILAIAANMLGKLIALQDQRTVTRERAMAIIIKNIEKGNEQVITTLAESKGSA